MSELVVGVPQRYHAQREADELIDGIEFYFSRRKYTKNRMITILASLFYFFQLLFPFWLFTGYVKGSPQCIRTETAIVVMKIQVNIFIQHPDQVKVLEPNTR